ncbi:hypothetical protein L228DRAFT_267839 [Xylona heveae TC161]|uniref:Aflatoxin regulatory protein domain-containing protein n=1 Tax=Xylona heveae (strain CBS 132557 / TC161) TaxID=1328760 RepID=A0A165HSK8_XYLHT|nr:hypothetical protein L228DRAFT_267839 [Xylona heveae TC161]KZF23882.1 hypothetical protein L228DRAFT_267839 [Xylona heveae TC161]
MTPPLSLSDTQYSTLMDKDVAIDNGQVTPGTEIFSFDYNWNPESAQDVLTLNGILETPPPEDDPLENTLQGHHNTMNDQQILTSHMNFASHCNHMELDLANRGNDAPLFLENNTKWNNNSNSFPTLVTEAIPSERGIATKTLLSLAFDLHERLEALETGPWEREGTYQALDSYPIGSVLHLSQEFTNVATVLRGVRPGDKTSSPSGRSSQSSSSGDYIPAVQPAQFEGGSAGSAVSATSSSNPASYFDTSVTHILLSCYVTLSRIYVIVLGHLQTYLQLQPSAQQRPSPTGMDFGPTVCLGELPSINAPWSRTHTAVCMLLDSIREAEAALGLPPQIRSADGIVQSMDGSGATVPNNTQTFGDNLVDRDLAIVLIRWGLLQSTSTSSIHEEFTALGKKVTDIKELLREKMGL